MQVWAFLILNSQFLIQFGVSKRHICRAAPQNEVGKFGRRRRVHFEILLAIFGNRADEPQIWVARAGVGLESFARAEVNRHRSGGEVGGKIGAEFDELDAFCVRSDLDGAFRARAILLGDAAGFGHRESALRLAAVDDHLRVFGAGGEKSSGAKCEECE